ncbi:hypothetical protein DICVIV_09915 [Dictyocaulus viviparus]|uniref:Transmembrane protein n=1 Tax=Dictyocaulus viviparus TaxID=29172 RepID=A0A0D8XHC5_DICVI|nr:hypothetical protein DICVIV_09915 [Dictyocaulus viviparus]
MIASTVKSSLVYQLFMLGHQLYSFILFFSLLFIYFYKGLILPYQYHVRILELLIILVFAPIEAARLSWGIRGNLTETPAFLVLSLFLSIPILTILTYLAIFQNYVLLIEIIIVGISGTLVILESVVALALCAVFSTAVNPAVQSAINPPRMPRDIGLMVKLDAGLSRQHCITGTLRTCYANVKIIHKLKIFVDDG